MLEEKAPKPWTKDNALQKAIRYCLYQERCTQDVLDKLISHKIYGTLQQQIIDQLIEDGYLDEARYVNAVIRGKSNALKWGENKIRSFLSLKRIPKSLINASMATLIDEDQNLNQLINLIEKKISPLKKDLDFNEKNKINAAMMRKGYSLALVQKAWDKIKRV